MVEQYVDLKRSGSSLKGLCPFHGEKTPSFYVTPSKGIYKCFGCGKAGDVFTFTQEMERIDFPEALKRLAEQAHVQLPDRADAKPSLKNRLYEVNEAAAAFFSACLRSDGGVRARAYLEKRQFGPEAVDLFALGYAPAGREVMATALRAKGFDDRILLAAGLVYPEENGGKPRDRFRARLMFPIRDASGKVVGFGGRTLGDEQPKYLNSPQTEIFDKSSVLFGIHRAAAGIREAKRAVLVEGYLDAIRAHLGAYSNTVASLGTSVTVPQLSALSRLTDTVILALDPDPAGQAAAARTAITTLAESSKTRGRQSNPRSILDLRVAVLPAGTGDPDEIIRDVPSEWEALINSSIEAVEFFFASTIQSLDKSKESWKQQAIERILPLIQQFSDSHFQARWVERLSKETGVDPRPLQRSRPAGNVSDSKRRRISEDGPDVVNATTSRGLTANTVDVVERSLLGLLLKLVVIPERAAELLTATRLKRTDHQAILDQLLRWRENANYDYEMFREHLTPPLAELADALHADSAPLPPDDRLTAAVAYHLERIKLLSLREEQRTIQSMLSEIDEEGKGAAVVSMAEILRQTFEVERNLQRLGQDMFIRLPDPYGTMDHEAGSL